MPSSSYLEKLALPRLRTGAKLQVQNQAWRNTRCGVIDKLLFVSKKKSPKKQVRVPQVGALGSCDGSIRDSKTRPLRPSRVSRPLHNARGRGAGRLGGRRTS